MAMPSKSASLRKAVMHVLLTPELVGTPCSFDQLVAPLGVAGGVAGEDDCAPITHELIRNAFKQRGGSSEYTRRYEDLGLEEPHTFLLVRVGHRHGNDGLAYELCSIVGSADDVDIELDDERIPQCNACNGMQNHPLTRPSVKRGIGGVVPDDVKGKLREFLRREKKEQKRQVAKAEADVKKAAGQAAAKAAAAGGKKKASAKISPVPDGSAGQTTKRQKKGSGTTMEEMLLEARCAALRKHILDESSKLKEMMDELDGMRQRRLASVARQLNDADKENATVLGAGKGWEVT